MASMSHMQTISAHADTVLIHGTGTCWRTGWHQAGTAIKYQLFPKSESALRDRCPISQIGSVENHIRRRRIT